MIIILTNFFLCNESTNGQKHWHGQQEGSNTVRAQSEPVSNTSAVQPDQPLTEQVWTPELASFSDQVIDLDSVPSPSKSKKRPAETLTKYLQVSLSQKEIKITKSIPVDILFEEENVLEPSHILVNSFRTFGTVSGSSSQ